MALFLAAASPGAANIAFEMRSRADSPVTFPNSSWSPIRAGADRRIFITIQAARPKAVAAIIFETAVSVGASSRIVSLERVSVVIPPGEKKRLTVSVTDVMEMLQAADASGDKVGNPVVTVVAVEFLDGTLWSAP